VCPALNHQQLYNIIVCLAGYEHAPLLLLLVQTTVLVVVTYLVKCWSK
jgi:hypothetical protein